MNELKRWVFLLLGTVLLAGCTGHAVDHSMEVSQDTASTRLPWQDVDMAYLQIPAGVQADAATLNIKAVSADGQVVVGEAERAVDGESGQSLKRLEAFRWDLTQNHWQWLGVVAGEASSTPAGVNAAADIVFGRRWVWQAGHQQLTDLGRQFWTYAVRDDCQLIGIESGSNFVLRSIDGAQAEQWPAADFLQLDAAGHAKERFWFSDNGTLVLSTVETCLKDAHCDQAWLTWWTPGQNQQRVQAELPSREGDFIQTDPGPNIVSRNAQWLAGDVGQGIFRWDRQGQMLSLGGFEHGADVLGISDDGNLVVGTTADVNTGNGRSWIWTATEGLGWLDEWLRNHGVAKEMTSTSIQVRLLSASRRVLIGLTDLREQGGTVVWWRATLPENLRVLVQ
ncbi:hypothetical protein [Saezia sanguinis]|uniref:hypothetical protein n=1 Tax=Saezia sanguinis TaxID=1965230 RepID=UPI003072FE87